MVASEFLWRLFQRAPRRQRQPPQPPSEPSPPSPPTHRRTERINTTPYVSRAVLESPGISDSTCQVNGDPHDPDRLPILPPDYTSLFDAVAGDETESPSLLNQAFHPQSQSPFFTQLPPEIRTLIYLHAFGGRRIHLDYDFTPGRNGNQWRWWHRVCDDESTCPSKALPCPETATAEATMLQLGSRSWVKAGFEYKIHALGWLRCCKIGYQESLPTLYGSNTFVLSQGIDQIFRVTRVMPSAHLNLVTSLCIEIDVYRICTQPPPKMDAPFRGFYQDLFRVINARVPNLRGLSLCIAGMPSGPRKAVDEWSSEESEMWVGPWEELAGGIGSTYYRSREGVGLTIAVPTAWVGKFEVISAQRGWTKGDRGKRGYSLVAGMESFRKGW
ncbi:hypothetical protein BJX76DRAFT_325786 [Aspergillus varians]